MIQRYIDRLGEKGSGGFFVWLDYSMSCKILKNVKVLCFNKLYPTILMILYKKGIINIPEDDAKKMDHYLNNIDLIKDDIDRMFVNGYYSKIDIDGRYKISYYAYLMYEEILEKNENIIYIDTDSIYYIDNIDLFDIDLPFKIEELDYFVIANKKRFVQYNSKKCIFEEKGFGRKTTGLSTKSDKYISEIRAEIRSDKLEKILN